jgi:hypothetical protein
MSSRFVVSNVLTSTNDVQFPTTFYNYEPFNYTFSNTNGSTIAVSGTYVSFCTGGGTTVITIDKSIDGFLTTGSTNGETIILTAGASTVTYKLYVLNGRFQLSPPISSIVLHRNEPLSITLSNLGYSGLTGITFASATTLTTLPYTSPTFPSSLLTLTNPTSDARTFLLSGSSPLLSASSNYYFVGSNSSNGRVVTTQFGIQVAGERMVLIPSSASNVLTISTTPITPITFKCYVPTSVVGNVIFTASNLPPGLSLSANSATPVSNIATVSITGAPSYPSSGITSFSTTLVATALGVSVLTASSALSFSYTQSIIFDAAETDFFVNISESYQLTANVFPTPAPVTFSFETPVPGLSLSSSGVLTGIVSSTTSANVIASSVGVSSVTKPLTITAVVVPISIVVSPSPVPRYVGEPIPTTTVTFSSTAYPASCNFIASNGVSITGLPDGFYSIWTYPSLTATFFGTVYSNVIPPGSNSVVVPFTITVTTIDNAIVSSNFPYTFLADSCTFSTITTDFSWKQNAPITPIIFTGTPASKLPIAYYYADNSLPEGLYVSPGGILQGTPANITSGSTLTGLNATTGNRFTTFSNILGTSRTYSVSKDSALLFATPSSVALAVSSPIPPISIGNQTVSGVLLSNTYYSNGQNIANPMIFTTYSYGLTVFPLYISGVLGTCAYPNDVVLPATVFVNGSFNPNSIPTLFGLSNTNPQIINRFIAAANDNTSYTIFNDSGTYDFSPVYTKSSTGVHSFQIISNATTSLSAWSGSLVVADGTPLITVSTSVSPPVFSSQNRIDPIAYSTYASNLGYWIAITNTATALHFTQSVGGTWVTRIIGSSPGSALVGSASPSLGTSISGYVIRMFGSILLLGGSGLDYCPMPTVPTGLSLFTDVTGGVIVNGNNVYDIAVSSSTAVAAGVLQTYSVSPGVLQTYSLAWSSDGIDWNGAVGSFTSAAFSVVYSGLPALGWFALGYNNGVILSDPKKPAVAWSLDGKTWTQLLFGFASTVALGPAQFDGTYWCFFVSTAEAGVFTLYQHDALVSNITDITTWSTRTISLPNMTKLYAFPTPIYTITGVPQPNVFVGATPTGPVFTSPTVTLYEIYQYVKITPILFSATSPSGASLVYFLTSSVPPGMVWDGVSTLSGLSVQLGTFSVSVYAQSTDGITLQTITFVVSRTPILPTLLGAADYTSYVREKVIADGATSAINNHTTPFEVGTFALERPPAVELAPELCCTTIKNIK